MSGAGKPVQTTNAAVIGAKCKLCSFVIDKGEFSGVPPLELFEVVTALLRMHFMERHPQELADLDRRLAEIE